MAVVGRDDHAVPIVGRGVLPVNQQGEGDEARERPARDDDVVEPQVLGHGPLVPQQRAGQHGPRRNAVAAGQDVVDQGVHDHLNGGPHRLHSLHGEGGGDHDWSRILLHAG